MSGEFASIIIMISFIAGSVWLQIFLSKSENKWLGLIIPSISFILSLLIIFNFVIFTNMTTTSIEKGNKDSSVIETYVISPSLGRHRIISTLITVVPIFLISNIPTIVYLAIYFSCREKTNLRKELDKMNIQDLG